MKILKIITTLAIISMIIILSSCNNNIPCPAYAKNEKEKIEEKES